MNITILLSRPSHDNLLSKTIRAVQKTTYSHVAVRYTDADTNEDMVFEAVAWGVRFIRYDIWLTLNTIIKSYDIDINYDQYIGIRKFMNLNSHKRYSFLQLIGIGYAKLFHVKRNLFDDESAAYICSELTARILMILDYEFNKDIDLITPLDIDNLLSP